MVNTKTVRRKKNDKWLSVAFLLPIFALIICITLIPIIIAFRTSLFETQYAETVKFIGLQNYISIFKTSGGWVRILNSIGYVVLSIVIVIPLGVGVGTLLNRKIRCRGLLRTIIILPWVLSQTVAALLWKWMLNSNYGLVTYFIEKLTGARVDFINSPGAARATVIFANVWNSFPIVLILTIAALQTISPEIYEAARVDGAGGWKIFRSITLPMIQPTIKTAVLMESIEYFNMVTLIYVMTAGGPFDATKTVSVAAFQEGFDFWHLGIGSAYSIVIFLLNIIFSVFYLKLLRSHDET